MKKIELKNNWKFKITNSSVEFEKYNSWMDCVVPGTVHTDLLHLGLIEDPYFEDNEKRLQWLSEQDWIYKTSFELPENFDSDTPINLVFEGVDTIAEAWLNGKLIGDFQNMFRTYDFEISKLLKTQNNLLEVKFYSPTKYAEEQEKKYGKLPVALNSERVYIRKAQYSFGWDWGPSFPTLGLWKPVYLVQRSKAYIQNISFNTIELKDDTAKVEVDVLIGGTDLEGLGVDVSLELDEQSFRKFSTSLKFDNKFSFEIESPKLWFPCYAGKQSLYNLKVDLKSSNGEQLDLVEYKAGIRTINLKLNENKKSTFKFVINNKDIFIKGVNWIPADLFLPRVTKEEYQKLILLAKKANCNMIRVWGGGVYEQDYFYELCDEHGILVWQDFMFACGSYPEHDEFIENINKEIHQVLERLQHHPSIALWCGNNENEWIWYQTQREPIETMSGFKIFHNIIPNIVKESDPERSYWPSSPFGYDEDPNDQQSGNTHQWDIWSNWIDYSEVTKDNSFFVSEFGFQGPANINTLEKCLSPEHRKIQDEKFEFHNKQVEGPERVLKFLAGHLPISTNWQDFIYLSQLNQGLALKRCIEHWRANRPRTNGSIIWQLNDCWPVVSWSLVDSSYLPKMAYYFVKRAFAPAVLLFKLKNSSLKIYGLNQGLSSLKGYIKLVIINLSSAEILYEITKKAILIENSYKSAINIPKAYQKNIDEYIYIVTFYSEKDELIIRNFYITKEWKYIETPKPNIEIKKGQSKKKNEINITTDKPAFFVDLYHPELSFSDRGFFILPEEKITLDIIGKITNPVIKEDIKIYSLNNYLKK